MEKVAKTRLTVTEAELADVAYVWDGEELFGLTNQQLYDITVARNISAHAGDSKKTLVKAVLDAQIAGAVKTSEPAETAKVPEETSNAVAKHALARSGLSAEEFDALADEDKDALLSQAKGELDAEEKRAQAGEQVFLYGSSLLPSMLKTADGVDVQLGTLVGAAFTKSGLSADEWNALEEADREERLAVMFGELDLYTVEAYERKIADEAAAQNAEAARVGTDEVKFLLEGSAAKDSGLHGHIDDLPNPLKN